jgi:4a-hydroxytetrahydrobiopterin dehydratase
LAGASNASDVLLIRHFSSAFSRLRSACENFPQHPQKTCRIAIANGFWGATSSPDMADLIKAEELKNRLKKIPEWELEKKHIERTFEFDDFTDSIDFVNAVAEVSEDEEHHPDIDIRYNKVRLLLSTHSKGGLTDLDFSLAERIDTLAE